MTGKYLLAIDQGTSSSRTVIYDHDANVVASAQQEFPQIYPRPGWVEHDPEAIWSSVTAVTGQATAAISAATAPTSAMAWPVTAVTDDQMASGSCSTQPGRG